MGTTTEPLPGAQPTLGEGLETAWEHSWPWPVWGTVLVWLALTALVVFLYARERGRAGWRPRLFLAGVRIALCTLILWMLHGWMRHQHRTDLPDVVVLIDDSASMATVDRDPVNRPGGATASDSASNPLVSRWERALKLLSDEQDGYLRRLQGRYRVKVFLVGRTARQVSLGQGSGTMASEAARNATTADKVGSGPEQAESPDFAEYSAVEPATRLGQCLLDVLQLQRGRPTAAIVILSDGVTTEGRALAEGATAARRRQIPLFCVGIGSERAPVDIRLTDLVTDEVAFVGDLVAVEARLGAAGFAGKTARVRLVRTDRGQLLAEQSVTLPPDKETIPVRLAFRPQAQGDYPLALVLESLPGEATLENNRLTRTVTVREETLKVLLVQAYPSYEYRFLKTLLQRQLKRVGEGERAIELGTLLQEADPEYSTIDETALKTFPVNREELFRYDVIVFGDVDPSLLGSAALEQLSAFVMERGGGLVVCAGPRFTPAAYRDTKLAELLPVDLGAITYPETGRVIRESFHPRLSSLGVLAPPLQLEDTPEKNRQTWNTLPPIYWLASATKLRAGARVLLEHPARSDAQGVPLPVVAVQFIGAGKVVMQLTDDSWRWSRSAAGDAAYSRYWLQMLRWLSRSRLDAGGRLAQVTADRERYETADRVELRVRFFDERAAPGADDGVTLMLQRENAGTRTVTLQRDSVRRGLFAATLEPLAEGEYRVWLVAPDAEEPPATKFTVVAPAGEQTRLTLDAAELRGASQLTGGRYYSANDAAKLPDELPRGQQVRIESLPPQPIWNRWPVPLAVVGLLTIEWLLRKRSGML